MSRDMSGEQSTRQEREHLVGTVKKRNYFFPFRCYNPTGFPIPEISSAININLIF